VTGTHVPTPRAASGQTDVVGLLDHADRAVDAVVTPVTAQEGLSREGWRILLLLSRGGGRSMGEIAEHAAIPNPTATRVVDRLVAHALAFRRTDPQDRRRVLVHLAPHGRDVVERVSRKLEVRVDLAFGPDLGCGSELRALLARLAGGALPAPAE
jgi:DNA-binding MarR family transcriptional regulator